MKIKVKALLFGAVLAFLGGCATAPSGAPAERPESTQANSAQAPADRQEAPAAQTPGGAVPGGALPPTESDQLTRLSPPPDFEEEEPEVNDPFEPFNRKVYQFNDFLDRNILQPVARTYQRVTPTIVRKGVSNFFNNLLEPTVILNDVLQGKFRQSLADGTRFVVNSTVGLLGLFDVATGLGLEKHQEDFGQTLAVWGVPDGPFLVLPFFGPRNARDTVGFVADWYTDPVTYVEDTETRWGLRTLNYIDTRAQLLGASSVLEEATDDPYVFVREAYRQRRQNLIHDGQRPAGAFP